MRRTIRLTGRRQLAISTFGFRFSELHGKRIATLTLADPAELKGFPPDAEIRVKLVENKLVEILRFGTVGKPVTAADIAETSFIAPSCQIRIVSRAQDKNGLLLGSTAPWVYRSGSDPDGILLFKSAPTAPRSWKLNFNSDDDHPILYVDQRIPEAALWAKTDPVFTACVFPYVISEVMGRILQSGSRPEDGWMADWLLWADALMPGSQPPFADRIDRDQREWIDQLVEAFAFRHDLAENILRKLEVGA